MLEKKQIRMIFSFEFKMGGKAAEMTHNINNAFGLGPANEYAVQWWFEKFCKGDKSLEDEEHSGQPSEVDNDQLRGSSKLILLKLHKRLLKNWTLTILWSFGIWSKLERWKSSIIGCLMSWLKKKMSFWSVFFSYSVLFHSIYIHSVMTNSLQPHGLYVSHQTHMSMEFSRQEYWSGLPFPFLGNLPDLGIEPGSPALWVNSLPF